MKSLVEVEKRNGLKIYEGKDDYTDRQYGRCAHPNTVWGRVAPRKVEVHGFSAMRKKTSTGK